MLVSVLTIMSSINVHADAYSNWKTLCTLSGVTYKGQSFVYAGSGASGNGVSWGSAWTQSSKAVGAGKLGAAARLYKSNGALVKSTTPSYSGGTCAVHRATTSTYYGHGNFYAKGTSYVYNGNGYNSYSLYSSPIQTAEHLEPEVNDNGKTYGSEYFLNMQGIEPDLILAEGINGKEGYIKKDDINREAKTLDEAVVYDSSEYQIPVYDVNGTTIIDTFVVCEAIVE